MTYFFLQFFRSTYYHKARINKSTTVYVPSSELGLSQHLSRQRVCPSRQKGGHTRLRVRGWGSLNSDDLRKSLALCLLCGAYILIFIRNGANRAHFFRQRDANEAEMKNKTHNFDSEPSCRAKFLVPDWGIWNIVDSGIELSYNPTTESTISPSQGLRIWLQITMTESERFGLIFAKTGSINLGTGTSGT